MVSEQTGILSKLLLLILLVIALFYGKELLMPIAIGAMLATLFLPFCAWLEQKRLARWVACLCSLIVLVSIGFSIFSLLKWQISSLLESADFLKSKITSIFYEIQLFIYQNFGVSQLEQNRAIKDQQPFVWESIPGMLGSFADVLKNTLFIIVYFVFLLYYRGHIKEFILKLFKSENQQEVSAVVGNVTHVSQQYLVGLAKMIFCLWIMYGIGFSILGVKNALFFAVLCGLLEIVPFVGNLTGTSITLLFAAAQGANNAMLLGILLTYMLIQFIQGWILEPIIVGPQVKINPLATILALIVWEMLWGIPGIILAIPITAMFKIVCDHIPAAKSIGFLLGEVKNVNTIKHP